VDDEQVEASRTAEVGYSVSKVTRVALADLLYAERMLARFTAREADLVDALLREGSPEGLAPAGSCDHASHSPPTATARAGLRPPRPRRILAQTAAIGWAKLLARVFALDITRGNGKCGGRMRRMRVLEVVSNSPASNPGDHLGGRGEPGRTTKGPGRGQRNGVEQHLGVDGDSMRIGGAANGAGCTSVHCLKI
jgi:hypothetical protein